MDTIKIQKLSVEQKKELDIPETLQDHGRWLVWECEPSVFDWHYDQTEQAYVFEGRVTVKTDKETVLIAPGDFVTFPKGLSCRWEISDKVRKVYTFI